MEVKLKHKYTCYNEKSKFGHAAKPRTGNSKFGKQAKPPRMRNRPKDAGEGKIANSKVGI
jgi:hypothetical protein